MRMWIKKCSMRDMVCIIMILMLVDSISTATVCNTQENGQFKCECTEISEGLMDVDCSSSQLDSIPSEGFPDYTSHISFKNNRILQIQTNDFLTAPSLSILNLGHNLIGTIQPNAFRGLTSLRTLKFDHNKLTSIQPHLFSELVDVTTIDLKQNGIYSINSNAFYFMPHLQEVELQGVRLQCDCETRQLRSWARSKGVSLAGAKCSNFIKTRDLEDVPDDQFGECIDPPGQTCTACSRASSLEECMSQGTITHCGTMDSCQVTIDITSGQQVVTSRCQRSEECIDGIKNNRNSCQNDLPDQLCIFCCTGPDCNKNIRLEGYSYQTSMVVSFTLRQLYDADLPQDQQSQLSSHIVQQLYSILYATGDIKLQFENFRPSMENQTVATLYAVSTWDMSRGVSHVQGTIYQTLQTSITTGDLRLDIIPDSLMVYTLGYCEEEMTSHDEGDFYWPNTRAGSDETIICPFPERAGGMATRSCVSVWHEQDQILMVKWKDPDVTQCVTPSDVSSDLKYLLDADVTNDSISSIVQSLRHLTTSNITATDVNLASQALDGVLNADVKMDDQASHDVIATYDNLLATDADTILKSQLGFGSIERVLVALDKFSSLLMETPDDVITESQISIGVIPRDAASQRGATVLSVRTPVGNQFQIGQVSLTTNKTKADDSREESTILLPQSVLDSYWRDGAQFVAFSDETFFKAMVDNSSGRITSVDSSSVSQPQTAVNSVIMAASLAGSHVENLPEPVVITFRHKNKGEVPKCVHWDFSAGQNGGAWSTRGCHVTEHVTDEYTVCECNHLTNFALLMDIYGEGADIGDGHKVALNVISYVGCGISLAALLLTLITYSVFRKLHKDNPSKLLMNLCIALSMVMILFVVVTQPAVWQNKMACQAMAGLLHYFLLSTWMWMAVEAFYMYLALIKIFKTYISRFILKSCLVGWGVPAVIVIITVAVSTDNYGQQGEICWLATIPFYWSCLAPIALILVTNFVVFGMVVHQLRKLNARNDKRSSMKNHGIKTQLRGAVAVVILLGLTWVFAIFAVGKASLAFQYLFCIFNSFQGLFIFVFYCVLKKDVKDIWRKKWTEFTSSASSNDRTYGKGGRGYLSSRTGSTPHTMSTDSPRISTFRKTTDRGTHSGSTENLNDIGKNVESET